MVCLNNILGKEDTSGGPDERKGEIMIGTAKIREKKKKKKKGT